MAGDRRGECARRPPGTQHNGGFAVPAHSRSRLASDARGGGSRPRVACDRGVPQLVCEREVDQDDRAQQSGERHQRQRIVRCIHPAARIRVEEDEDRAEREGESAGDADGTERREFLEAECARVEHRWVGWGVGALAMQHSRTRPTGWRWRQRATIGRRTRVTNRVDSPTRPILAWARAHLVLTESRRRSHLADLTLLLVALTGNIASGKSSVAAMLVARGATLIDADVLARRAVDVGTPAYDAIVKRWGAPILLPDGGLDRGALRRIVFQQSDELRALNAIVHPVVERMRADLVGSARGRGDRLVVCDIPLLFENNLADGFDRIVLVDAPRPLRLDRLARDRGLRETEAMAMIAQQMPADLKRARADFVIDNDRTLGALESRVDEVWRALADEADTMAQRDSLTLAPPRG